jgi:hypothetical protein
VFNVVGNYIKCRVCNENKTLENYYMKPMVDEERIMDQAVAGTMLPVEKLKGPDLYKTCKKCYRDKIITN